MKHGLGKSRRAMGFLPSAADPRDLAFSAPEPVEHAPVLPVPFVRDQGRVPCCVSIAVATCMEIIDAQSPGLRRLAPLFNYFVSRNAESLDFVEPREALKQATKVGIASAATHPDPERYTPGDARRAPTDEALEDARRHGVLFTPNLARAVWYERLSDSEPVGAWLAALDGAIPILIGFFPGIAYWSLNPTSAALTPSALGGTDGHAAVVVGTAKSNFVVQDSRGRAFGKHGQWLLPFSLVPNIVEAWVIRKVTYD
jgi:hypothetical protein